ncbi:hypothetical protein [Helicobacter brantae]|uniref:Uncharacterized protein n=1 Tax=Helicobacter brantae TaxID=375927 RepID=A0A3D8IY35_9HELI|nr:hypothetical protein [Helicobacter brantae]RDU70189.1 hypothetical protein CQA58_06155 [Helicobacter brantae]
MQKSHFKRIRLSLEELRGLVFTFKTKIYCQEELWNTLTSFITPLDNSNAKFREGEVISNNSLMILRTSSQKILDIWKSEKVGVLSLHNQCDLPIEVEILSLTDFYLCLDLENKILGFLVYSLAEEMLECFDSQENPTQKGRVIEKMIDRLLDVNLLVNGE